MVYGIVIKIPGFGNIIKTFANLKPRTISKLILIKRSVLEYVYAFHIIPQSILAAFWWLNVFYHRFAMVANLIFKTLIIIKIAISSIVIGSKNSYFPLIHLPSCYRTACYRTVCYRTVQQTNHIQSCSLNQPITT